MALCGSQMITLLILLVCLCPMASSDRNPKFESIYQFGDSTSDTGNPIRERDMFDCLARPYGETSFDKPSGRCSNGLLIVDYFAREFNLPLVNPYLAIDADFSQGVNFAVHGATAINASGTVGSVTVQLGWFQNHIKSVGSSFEDCKKKLERSLFVVGEVGANDYKYDILNLNSDLEDVYELVPIVLESITDVVKGVIEHGARHVLVPGMFPIGCEPAYLDAYKTKDITSYDNDGCVSPLNALAEWHNENLQKAIKELQNQHPEVAIYYGDYFSSFLWVLQNAASLGFEREDVFKPCCGSITHPCGSTNNEDIPHCPDPTKRISWDGIQQTQQTYRYMASWLLKNTFPQDTSTSPSPSPSSSPSPSPSPSPYWSQSSAVTQFPLLFQLTIASMLVLWEITSSLLS